jgi:DNA-binding LacI/PurR family transcriptional regulator
MGYAVGVDSKSRMIYHDILNRILTGDLSRKTSLPTEMVLAKHYQCSRPTLRKALEELKTSGVVTSVRGSGAYINVRSEGEAPKTGNLFGIIFPNLGPGYLFDPLCNHLAQYASLRGDSIVWSGYVAPWSETLKFDITQICERYIAQKIAGLFFAPFEYHQKSDILNKEIVTLISDAGIPVVLIDSNIEAYPAYPAFDLVSMDHIQASYLLTEHVIEQGFERIFFTAPPNSHHTIKLRLTGYHEALIDRRLVPEPLVECGVENIGAVRAFIDEKKPDAIICSNDFIAMGLINTLEKLKVDIPDDIAVAGFDHLSALMPFSRPITSIEQPVASIARTALELMLARVAAPDRIVSHITFPGVLFTEATTCRRARRGDSCP